MPGVSNVNVDFDTKSVTLIKDDSYDEDTTLEKLDGRGFTSTVAE